MKKILTAISVCSVFIFSLCSCSDKQEETTPSKAEKIVLEDEIIQPINDYFRGFNENDADVVLSSFTPQVIVDGLKEKEIYEDELAVTENDITATHDYWAESFGDNATIEFTDEVSHNEFSEQSLKNTENYFKIVYFDIDFDIEIEQGYEMTYRYTITSDSTTKMDTETACFVKVKDDGWKMICCKEADIEAYNPNGGSDTEESEDSEE